MSNTRSLGITDIVLPCVDESRLTSQHDWHILAARLQPAVALCESLNVNLALETDLCSADFAALLDIFGSPRVTVNYDVGNSASLGFDPTEEWRTYGSKVSSVHIKDRVLHGASVPLGSGSARFEAFFRTAHGMGFRGLFVLQAARDGNEIEAVRRYKGFVQRHTDLSYAG